MDDCIIISVKHTLRAHRYITLWAPNDRGYRWRLSAAGRYSRDAIMGAMNYYNTGCDIAVPAEVVESLARPGNPCDFDGMTLDMPMSELLALPNTKDVWEKILAAVVAPTKYKPSPDYPGSRRKKEQS